MTTAEPEPSAAADGGQIPAVGATLAALSLAERAVTAYGREDLAARVTAARRRLDDPAFRVLVVGEFKQGKSSLVNALLDTSVCPVDDDIATSAPTAVSFASQPSARVIFRPSEDDPEAEPQSEDVALDEVRRFVTEAADPADERRVQSVELGVPSPLLADGLVLVDTPGVGGLGSVHGAITAAALPMADGVLFLSDASQEFSEPELTFLRQALALCPNLVCVLTKTDFYPAWRKILDLDRGHLTDAGLDLRIIPVSATLRVQALVTGDGELDAESGFPELIETLRTEVVGDGERRSVNMVCAELLTIVEQLDSQFSAEQSALQTPANNADLQRELEAANQRADLLRSQTARWAQTLGDGIGDLASDVEHDLRTRMRQIIKEGDGVIDDANPSDIWAEFEPWLYRRTAEDVVNNFRFLQARADALSAQVAELFAIDEQEVPFHADLADAGTLVRRASPEASADFNEQTRGQRAMTGLRGGYMGVLMFGALGGMVGLTMGGIPVAAGMLMGRKALREEKGRQLTARRSTAKNTVRKYLDEAQFLAGKDSRDTLRRVQRELRDHYTARAEGLQRSVTETRTRAQQAMQADAQTRAARLRDVNAELKRIQMLRKQVREARELAEESA